MIVEGLQKGGEGHRIPNEIPLKEIKSLKEGKGRIRENEKEIVDETRESEVEGKKAEKIEEFERVKALKNEVTLVWEKYLKIQAEDNKYRGKLSMDIYNISRSLYDTKRRLKRIKHVRRHPEKLYKKNIMLRAQVRKLKNDANNNKGRMDTRRLDVLA